MEVSEDSQRQIIKQYFSGKLNNNRRKCFVLLVAYNRTRLRLLTTANSKVNKVTALTTSLLLLVSLRVIGKTQNTAPYTLKARIRRCCWRIQQTVGGEEDVTAVVFVMVVEETG